MTPLIALALLMTTVLGARVENLKTDIERSQRSYVRFQPQTCSSCHKLALITQGKYFATCPSTFISELYGACPRGNQCTCNEHCASIGAGFALSGCTSGGMWPACASGKLTNCQCFTDDSILPTTTSS